MFVSNHITVNDKNHLSIGGCDALLLAKEFGTPLYVLDEATVRENCSCFVAAMKESYQGDSQVLYAGKALSTGALLKLINQEGLGLDVVSGGELYTAKSVDFPMEKVFFHGNNKTDSELSMALSFGVGRFVVDNEFELLRLNDLAKDMGKTASVLLRITPGIDAHTHAAIRTGQVDSKFGVALGTGEATQAVSLARSLGHIDFCGLHCHIGSQIFEEGSFVLAAETMMHFILELKTALGAEVRELNLGGGFGIAYEETDGAVDYAGICSALCKTVEKTATDLGLSLPKLYIEPGRSIVGAAGVTLYTVGALKEIPGVRTYVTVDGGMADNPRYCLYQAPYTFVNAGRAGDEKTFCATIAGRCCESGDLLGEHVMVQPLMPRDILAVLSTGAYHYSMASNYNRLPKPPMVMTKDGTARVIIKGETYEDLIRNDIV